MRELAPTAPLIGGFCYNAPMSDIWDHIVTQTKPSQFNAERPLYAALSRALLGQYIEMNVGKILRARELKLIDHDEATRLMIELSQLTHTLHTPDLIIDFFETQVPPE